MLDLDPRAQLVLYGAAAVVLLAIVLRVIAAWLRGRRTSQIQASVRRSIAERERRAEDHARLGGQIVATSSTAQLVGFEISRQVETVVSDGEPASSQAMSALKSAAARRGANAIINVQVRQSPGGKWIASGDAVIVLIPIPPAPSPPSDNVSPGA